MDPVEVEKTIFRFEKNKKKEIQNIDNNFEEKEMS